MAKESKKIRDDLQNKYKFLRAGPIEQDLMSFGFDCGDGWLPILEDLFMKIDDVVKRDNLTEFKVVQVKEKFGGLRVYVRGGNAEITALINGAEETAAETCEDCGNTPAQRRSVHGYVRTQCSKCHAVSNWEDVVSARIIDYLEFEVTFADGLTGKVRILPSFLFGVFEKLKDPVFFNQIQVTNGFVTWPGELDLAPDAMYDAIKKDGEWIIQ